ncbi:MAG: hypothetical protein EOP47_13865 [Sphingobacteriaceae bacterium]|nr:MAG: hypothetical protein EOP47_13865 [Sphingobacteriaceae bacterium]
MKKLLSIAILLAIVTAANAQWLRLSGTAKGIPAGDSVEVTLPFNGEYYADNSIYIKPDTKQHFTFNLSGKSPKFIQLRYKTGVSNLLLIPGKLLRADFDAADMAKTIALTGSAKNINERLLSSALNNRALLINNLYDNRKWSADSLVHTMLPAVKKELNTTLTLVDEAAIPAKTKAIICTELKYYYANTLLLFSGALRDKMSRDAPWAKLQYAVIHSFALPGSDELASSPAASTYIHYYMVNQLHELSFLFKENPSDQKNIIETEMGMPYDTVMNLAHLYGEDYLLTLLSKKYLSAQKRERLLANVTLKYAGMKELRGANQLQNDLAASFPNSTYLNICQNRISNLENLVGKNSRNKNIIFVPDSTKITTLKELVAPYKGKVVYLDIWGTWCGPCKSEIMLYSAQLKTKFANNKDIVFLYLEMDQGQAGSVEKWKEFVNMHNVAGTHVRIDKTIMDNLWIELLGSRDVPRMFPTYVIFDRDGNVSNKNANRPSAGEILYKDLELAIAK